MTGVLEIVLCLQAGAPLARSFFIGILADICAFKAVMHSEKAPVGVPHSMTCGLVCPKEPAEVKLVEGFEAVVPGCPLERIELTHHERCAEVIKPCKQAERGEDEVGVLIKMNLINNVLPALYPGVGEGGSRPDAFKRNDVVAVNGTDCIVKSSSRVHAGQMIDPGTVVENS